MADEATSAVEHRGWLMKWTNYMRGYQKRWFVLSDGLLSYYRRQEEMAHTCRGTINLASAVVGTIDATTFSISNGSSQVFYMRAPSKLERDRWITAIERGRAAAVKALEADEQLSSVSWPESIFSFADPDTITTLRLMAGKLSEMTKCNELLTQHTQSMQQDLAGISNEQMEKVPALRQVHEKALLIHVSSTAMMGACSEFMSLSQSHHQHLSSMMHEEEEQRLCLEETVERIAKQHNTLEKAVQRRSLSLSSSMRSNGDVAEVCDDTEELESAPVRATLDEGSGSSDTDDESDDEFFDAEDDVAHVRSLSVISAGEASNDESTMSLRRESLVPDSWPVLPPRDPSAARKFRTHIPLKPQNRISLWSVMKSCIGRELSKIPMPVNFNEPLSMLQRLCEVDLEFSNVLDRAAALEDSLEQLAMVACYTVSSYSSTTHRTGKPFNPLLGETFEFDATADRGWRCLCEQVSHHPPSSAMHVESRDWMFWQDYTMASKFRGKYLQILPQGVQHLVFRRSQNHYTWRKVVSTVHNIIVGKLWVDQSGEIEIVNHKTGDYCLMKYHGYSYFAKDSPRKVTGVVYDVNKEPHFHISGSWDKQMEYTHASSSQKSSTKQTLVWLRPDPSPGLEAMYGFGDFACALNEPLPGVAPTDSRFRPDQREMEKGDYGNANSIKVKLEDAQRMRRKECEARIASFNAVGNDAEADKAQYKPRWFQAEKDPLSGMTVHVYKGNYWESKETGWQGDFLDLWSAAYS